MSIDTSIFKQQFKIHNSQCDVWLLWYNLGDSIVFEFVLNSHYGECEQDHINPQCLLLFYGGYADSGELHGLSTRSVVMQTSEETFQYIKIAGTVPLELDKALAEMGCPTYTR